MRPSQKVIRRRITYFSNFSEIYIFTNKNQKPPGLRVDKNGMLEGPPKMSEISAPLPTEIPATLMKIRFFFEKKHHFRGFRGPILSMMGVRLVRNFFWGDRHRLGVKPHSRPKSRTGPPQPSASRF